MRSIKLMRPSFEWRSVDLIVGMNCLRQLFHFTMKRVLNASGFRIDLEIIGTTIFMTRWDAPRLLTEGSPCAGYGRGFEMNCVAQQSCPHGDPTSYHRVVNYIMGGLNCVVQFEADAYDGDLHLSHTSPGEDETVLTDGMQAFSLDENDQDGVPAPSELSVLKYGCFPAANSIVEIKSRKSNSHDVENHHAHMWFSGVRRLVLGRHFRGCFAEIDDRNNDQVHVDLQQWSSQRGPDLQRVYGLLREIHSTVLRAKEDNLGHARYALVVEEDKKWEMTLHLRSGGQDVLPEHCL